MDGKGRARGLNHFRAESIENREKFQTFGPTKYYTKYYTNTTPILHQYTTPTNAGPVFPVSILSS